MFAFPFKMCILRIMKYEKVLDYYRSVKSICTATGLSHQAVYYWKKTGKISREWQLILQAITKGKLKPEKRERK